MFCKQQNSISLGHFGFNYGIRLFSSLVLSFYTYMFPSIVYAGENDSYIEDRLSFDNEGKLLHRKDLAYLNFVDGFPKVIAHRGSSYLERYVESMNIVISDADMEPTNVQDTDRLINVFFGKDYFSRGLSQDDLIQKNYNSSMVKHNIQSVKPISGNYQALDVGCIVKRRNYGSILGESFIVIDSNLDDFQVEKCLYIGISYSFGIQSSSLTASPMTMIDRNIDILVHGASQQCLEEVDKSKIVNCTRRIISNNLF